MVPASGKIIAPAPLKTAVSAPTKIPAAAKIAPPAPTKIIAQTTVKTNTTAPSKITLSTPALVKNVVPKTV